MVDPVVRLDWYEIPLSDVIINNWFGINACFDCIKCNEFIFYPRISF